MADQFLGEIRMIAFDFAPIGWALCDGQLMPISQYAALFSLLGVNFGGDGRSTFGLPNLQGNVAMDFGDGIGLTPRNIGETGGTTNVTLLYNEMAMHTHLLNGDTTGGTTASKSPANNVYTETPGSRGNTDKLYVTNQSTQPITLDPTFISPVGGNLPHSNQQPYLVVKFAIAFTGQFPARS